MELRKIKSLLTLVTFIAVTNLYAKNSTAEVVVVVSAQSSVSSLTKTQVAKIYLGKTGTFPSGETAIPLDQAEGRQIRNEFYQQVTGKSPAQINAYWAKIIFAGDGQPPGALNDGEDIKRNLAQNPNAIGYIDSSKLDSSVRVVLKPSN